MCFKYAKKIEMKFNCNLTEIIKTGVFLIPYTTMLIFGALPLFFLELSVGQFTKSGPITIWNKICPPMKGIGYCCVLISWYVSFYYNVIIAWTTYYIIKTITSGK